MPPDTSQVRMPVLIHCACARPELSDSIASAVTTAIEYRPMYPSTPSGSPADSHRASRRRSRLEPRHIIVAHFSLFRRSARTGFPLETAPMGPGPDAPSPLLHSDEALYRQVLPVVGAPVLAQAR